MQKSPITLATKIVDVISGTTLMSRLAMLGKPLVWRLTVMVIKLIRGRTVGLELIQRGFALAATATQGVAALKPDSAGLFCSSCIMLSIRSNLLKKGSFV